MIDVGDDFGRSLAVHRREIHRSAIEMPTERDWLTEPLETLGLAPRPFNCLTARGVKTVGDLCSTPIDELLSGQSWGDVTLSDARAKLAVFDLRLFDDWAAVSVEDLKLSLRAASLMRELRVQTIGELLALTTEDLFRFSFRETAVRDVIQALKSRGLILRDCRR